MYDNELRSTDNDKGVRSATQARTNDPEFLVKPGGRRELNSQTLGSLDSVDSRVDKDTWVGWWEVEVTVAVH